MEKTIEQRAKEVFPSTGLNDPTWERRGYIQGAIDQQKIDIEKACEALYGLMFDLNCDLMDIEEAKKYVRKAMLATS